MSDKHDSYGGGCFQWLVLAIVGAALWTYFQGGDFSSNLVAIFGFAGLAGVGLAFMVLSLGLLALACAVTGGFIGPFTYFGVNSTLRVKSRLCGSF